MHLTVFRNVKRADMDAAAYEADAARMIALAEQQDGFLAVKSYTAADGEVVTISEWRDQASAQAFRRVVEHVAVQAVGRAQYYESYILLACDEPRVHRFG